MRLFVLTRHGQSTLNLSGHINGDPTLDIRLTELGENEAHRLGLELAHVPLELCVHTRYPRTRQTAELALAGRDIPLREEPLLDDIAVGELEGATHEEYRAWKLEHVRDDAFPGGESLNDAARRYARGLRAVLEDPAAGVLVVCHEIPVRYALNAASDSHELDGPARTIANATPYLFDEESLARAADRIETLAR